MGQSTDAILVFGLNIPENFDPSPIADALDVDRETFDDWDGIKDHLETTLEVTLVVHCSNTHPMYIVALNNGKMGWTAWRGYPREVATLPRPTEEQTARLRKAAEVLGLPFDPKWWLVSWWG